MSIIDLNADIGTTPLWGVPFSEANLKRVMQKYSVDYSLISSTIGCSCDFTRGNQQVASIVKNSPELFGCAIVNIHYPEQSHKELHKYLMDENFAGIIITSGDPSRYITLEEADDILNSYRRFTKPVFLEVKDKYAALAANEIAKAFPIMKFILLGMGGRDWRMTTMLAEKTLNLVLEVSGSFSPDKIAFAVEHIGAHRMVYGSGLPYVDPASVKGLVEDAEISDSDKRLIFSGSAKRIFKWK